MLAASAGHHAVGPGLPEIVSLLNLLVVVAVIYVFARKGIVASVATRSSDIFKNLKSAHDELTLVEARLKKAKSEYNDLTAKKREVIDAVRAEGERVSAQIVEDTRKSAAQILSDAELSAKSEVKQAAQRIRRSLVDQTFEQTLGQLEGTAPKAREQKTDLHEKLFEKFVSEIPQQLKSTGGSANGS